LTRERVIKDIGNIEEAVKVEETVRTGYCDVISDNLNLWIAVEEDIEDSYNRLSKKVDPKAGRAFEELALKSGDTVKTLRKLSKTLEELDDQQVDRIRVLGRLGDS